MYLKHMRPYQLHDAVERELPLLIPAGCIECHGPHMAIGHDTIIVEDVCERIAEQMPCVIAPSFDYGPTGYAVSGPEMGTVDPDYTAFGLYVKSVLRAFLDMGFKTIVTIIMHQGMEMPLALAFKKAAAELSCETALETRPRGWWGARPPHEYPEKVFGRIQVYPMILPEATPPAGGDHAGYNETSFLLATHPDFVEQNRLDEQAPWYCHMGEEKSSATANEAHGRVMMDAVVAAWVDRLKQDR